MFVIARHRVWHLKVLFWNSIFCWFCVLNHAVAGDAELRFEDLKTILSGMGSGDGPYSTIGPLFAAPLVIWGAGDPWLTEQLVARFNVIVFAVTILIAWWAFSWRLELGHGFLRVGATVRDPGLWARIKAGEFTHLSVEVPVRIGRSSIDDNRALTFWRAAVIAAVFSMFPKHLQGFYAEPFSACALFLGVVVPRLGPPGWRSRLGWLGFPLAAANTPALLLPIGLVLGCIAVREFWWSWRDGYLRDAKWRILAPLFAAAGGPALFILENLVRFGSWHSSYAIAVPGVTPSALPFETPLLESTMAVWFDFPPVIGLWSILFSVGKGLAWFVPGLWLYLRGNPGPLPKALLPYLLAMIGLYSVWSCWHGDWYWGPRYFLFACFPASLLLAQELTESQRRAELGEMDTVRALVALGLLAASAWVGWCAAALNVSGMDLCQRPGMGFLCWYAPDYSALYRPFVRGQSWDVYAGLMAAHAVLVFVYLAVPTLTGLLKVRRRT